MGHVVVAYLQEGKGIILQKVVKIQCISKV